MNLTLLEDREIYNISIKKNPDNYYVKKKYSEKEINKICIDSSKKDLKNILSITKEPLVSVDFNHSPYSSNFDLLCNLNKLNNK